MEANEQPAVKVEAKVEKAGMNIWHAAATLGVGSVLALLIVPKLQTNNETLQTKLLEVIKEGNAIDKERVKVDTALVEVRRNEVSVDARRNEELDDLTDELREFNELHKQQMVAEAQEDAP